MRHLILALVWVLLLSPHLHAAPQAAIPDGIGSLPEGLGVNIHFTDPKAGEMEMLAAAGVRRVRMDFG